jgi:hypothetical protein
MDLYRRSPAATPDHPYLLKKKIKDVGPLKIDGEELLVPIYNAQTDKFQTYQRIKPEGTKPFPKNAVKVGGYALLGQRLMRVMGIEALVPRPGTSKGAFELQHLVDHRHHQQGYSLLTTSSKTSTIDRWR